MNNPTNDNVAFPDMPVTTLSELAAALKIDEDVLIERIVAALKRRSEEVEP